jgi:hypothetical protein
MPISAPRLRSLGAELRDKSLEEEVETLVRPLALVKSGLGSEEKKVQEQ